MAWHNSDIALNMTPSMRVGFYQKTSEAPTLWSIVTVRASDVLSADLLAALFGRRADGDYSQHTAAAACEAAGLDVHEVRMFKRIVAEHGDVIEGRGADVLVNGRVIAKRYTPSEANSLAGACLPYWNGARTLTCGEVLLLGDAQEMPEPRQCVDGRYLGPTKAAYVEACWKWLDVAAMRAADTQALAG